MSEATNFTPGPWTFRNRFCDMRITPRSDEDKNVTIATMGNWHPTCLDEQYANARLIAAAPTGHALIARAVADRIDDEWLKDARKYLEAVHP